MARVAMVGFGIATVGLGGALVMRSLQKMSRNKGAQNMAKNAASNFIKEERGFFAKRFYEGGFEDPMTRREAALILGCRENASKERVMERYRKLMRLNHPDLGGSPLLSTKVNEAKDLLEKRAKSEGDSKRRTRHRDRR